MRLDALEAVLGVFGKTLDLVDLERTEAAGATRAGGADAEDS